METNVETGNLTISKINKNNSNNASSRNSRSSGTGNRNSWRNDNHDNRTNRNDVTSIATLWLAITSALAYATYADVIRLLVGNFLLNRN